MKRLGVSSDDVGDNAGGQGDDIADDTGEKQS